MYCPKCGTKNLDPVRFCRKCGVGLPKELAKEGRFEYEESVIDEIAPYSSGSSEKPKKKQQTKASWEIAMFLIATGVAFLIVSVVLAYQPMGVGWWFWLLIPGFFGLGTGIGQVISLRQQERKEIQFSTGVSGREFTGRDREALPPNRTVFADDEVRIPEKTGEFAPPSVTESTTRHLELDQESETTKLKDEEKEL